MNRERRRLLWPTAGWIAAGCALVGLVALGVRQLTTEQEVAVGIARQRLQGVATEGAARVAAELARLEAVVARGVEGGAALLHSPRGPILVPEPPIALTPLQVVPGRDPEGEFDLAEAGRAETRTDDPKERERADGFYRAAAGESRDTTVRALAHYRRAALARREWDEAGARDHEAAFLALITPPQRRTLEALIVRARAPDDALRADLLAAVGGPDELVALGLLEQAGRMDPEGVRARRAELERIARLSRFLEVVTIVAEESRGAHVIPLADDALWLFAWGPAADGAGFAVSDGTAPPLPAGVHLLCTSGVIDASAHGDLLVELAFVGRPKGAAVIATQSRADVAREARRRVAWVAGALALMLVGGAVALFTTVRAIRRESAAVQARSDFVARVSHDLRTPLSVIRVYAETLAAGRVHEPEQVREFAGVAAREAENLTRRVERVLDFSKHGGGGLARRMVPREVVELRGVTRAVVESVRPAAAAAGVALEVEPADGPITVRVDREALESALRNLLDNGMRHAAAGGRIELAIVAQAGRAEVRVADRGPGVPAGWEERIFEPFLRAPDAAAGGSGLGLAVVREVARAHGGEATCRPREGGGALFVLSLPIEAASASKLSSTPASAPAASRGSA